jgi:hypothetical protein
MSDVIDMPADIEADPELIERCELCGYIIEDLEELIYLRAADLLAQLELADPRDAWRHTGEAAPPASVRNSDISGTPANAPRPYRPVASSIEAFLFVARNYDAAVLARWLDGHPQDVEFLTRLWETKNGLS